MLASGQLNVGCFSDTSDSPVEESGKEAAYKEKVGILAQQEKLKVRRNWANACVSGFK